MTLDDLTDPANLRAFVDATSDIADTPATTVLDAMAEVLERQLRRRSDDIDEVWLYGRLLQAVRDESDRTRHASGARH